MWLDLLPNINPNIRILDRFRQCGSFCWVEQDDESGQYYLAASTCKLRICPACRKRLQHRTAARVLDFLHQHPNKPWQFHTFTLKHSAAPLASQFKRLVSCFRRLRHRRLWTNAVTTGYAVLEVTFHLAGTFRTDGRLRDVAEWHPHLHVLAQTAFIDWSLLRKDWLSVTGDSNNIDCQHVKSASHAARYVAKYIGKPPDLDLETHPEHAAEYYHALAHRRLLISFGPAAKHAAPQIPLRGPSTKICRLADLIHASLHGNYPAQHILTRLVFAFRAPALSRPTTQQSLFAQHPT